MHQERLDKVCDTKKCVEELLRDADSDGKIRFKEILMEGLNVTFANGFSFELPSSGVHGIEAESPINEGATYVANMLEKQKIPFSSTLLLRGIFLNEVMRKMKMISENLDSDSNREYVDIPVEHVKA